MSVSPRGMSVQEAYSIFRKGQFRVNRRYQRKLVWLPNEKEALIDSILSGYPIPLILLAFHTDPATGSKTFEILDGMQRLNAIFAFIENEFPWRGKYFDVKENSRANQLAIEGAFTAKPSPLLPKPDCARLLEYTLAVTEFPAVNETAVNQVFSRINSYGRQLSDQEKRQAGVVSPFADVVREIASEIRGDVSRQTLDLLDMPEISISTPTARLSYGITAIDTFWCKQGILRANQLRDSEDEQMIADLAISILNGRPFAFSGVSLDAYYKPDEDDFHRINERAAEYGTPDLRHHIVSTISIIRSVIDDVDPTPKALARIVHPTSGANPIKTAFYAIFMAFFDLCIRQRRSPGSSQKILHSLQDLQSRLEIAAGQISTETREKNIAVTKGLIQDHFIEKEPPAFRHSQGAAMEFENALRRSRIETARYECKQGLLDLYGKRSINNNLLERITQTICAIANIGPDSSGALFLGVADGKSDKERVESLDRIQAIQIGERYVVGIDREATILGESIDDYKRRVVAHIRNSQLSDSLRQDVLSRIDCISYREREVIAIWIPPQREMSYIGKDPEIQVYEREGNDTVRKGPLQMINISRRFGQQGSSLPGASREHPGAGSSSSADQAERNAGDTIRPPDPIPPPSALKSPVKKSPVKKSPVKKSPVKKSPVKKSPVKKSPAKKSPAKK